MRPVPAIRCRLCYPPRVKAAIRQQVGLAAAALSVLGVVLGGCSNRAAPGAVVTAFEVTSRSAEAAVVEFDIEMANPNDIELPMRDVVYTLSLDGERVFSGRRDAQATMPREGTQWITIPAVVPMQLGPDDETGVAPGVYRYRLTGRVYYSLPSQLADVLFDAKLSRPSVGIVDEGEIDLR